MIRKALTIFFADVHGYTSRTARQSREENELFLKETRGFVEKNAKEKGGTIVKTMGDGFLLTFESPTDAVACGIEMQKQIEQRNINVLNQENLIQFRIGISTGEVTIDDSGDVFGDAVNIASRIQNFAEPNGVYISESTYLAMNKAEIKAMDLGPQHFKNALQQVRVYKILRKTPGHLSGRKNNFFSNKLILAAGIFLIAVIMVLLFLLIRKEKPVTQPQERPALTPEQRQELEDFLRRRKAWQKMNDSKKGQREMFLPQRGDKPALTPEQREKIIEEFMRRRKAKEEADNEKQAIPAP